MKDNMKQIVSFFSVYGEGATPVLVEQAISLFHHSKHQYFFFSGESEQQDGLFELMSQAGLEYTILDGLDSHCQLGSLVKQFRSYLKGIKPDVVHVHSNWQLLIAVLARITGRYSYRIVYTIHAYRNNYPIRRIIAKNIIGLALKLFVDRVIVICSSVGKVFNIVSNKTDVLFEGVDPKFMRKQELPEFRGTKRLVFAGQFRCGKNQSMLIRALSRYVAVTNDEDVKLYLPGKGEEKHICEQLAKKLDMADKVIFPGYLSKKEILELYLKCQYSVITSNNETFGMCIAEPFVLGRVVISRPVGVAEDIIDNNLTGFIFNTEEDLVEIFHMILTNESKSKEVSANAFALREQFDWAALARKYDNIIETND